jgi:hypothetical protein
MSIGPAGSKPNDLPPANTGPVVPPDSDNWPGAAAREFRSRAERDSKNETPAVKPQVPSNRDDVGIPSEMYGPKAFMDRKGEEEAARKSQLNRQLGAGLDIMDSVPAEALFKK